MLTFCVEKVRIQLIIPDTQVLANRMSLNTRHCEPKSLHQYRSDDINLYIFRLKQPVSIFESVYKAIIIRTLSELL